MTNESTNRKQCFVFPTVAKALIMKGCYADEIGIHSCDKDKTRISKYSAKCSKK